MPTNVSAQRADSPRIARRALYIDMAYCLRELRLRQHDQFFEARHSGEYFERIIGLHPLADRVTVLARPVTRERFSDRQDVIEGSAYAFPLPRWLAPINLLVSQFRLFRTVVRIVGEERIDCVIATDALYSGLFGSWVKRAARIPLSVLFVTHYQSGYEATGALGMPSMIPFKWLQDRVIRHVARCADLVGAGSRTLADYALAMGAGPNAIEVFPPAKNMTPGNRLPPDRRGDARDIFARFDIPQDVPLLITVARHAPAKLVDHSVRALAIVLERHPTAILLLAGAGPETDRLRRLADERGIERSVRFLGLVEQPLLSRLTPHCVALSPLTGMALFETSMAGAPAVAYDIDSQVAELVVPGRTGELVPYGDWRALGQAASRLLDDAPRLKSMSLKMRKLAEELTDEHAIYRHEAQAYERMFGRNMKSRRSRLERLAGKVH